MITQCFVSKRARDLYIVWTTLSGSGRVKHEPLLPLLGPWIIRTIKRRVKNTPNIPKIHWIYDNGSMPTEMPNHLVRELRAVHAATGTSIEQRVDYLKQLDSVQHKLRDIPWFMPYLWDKGRKTEATDTYRRDLASVRELDKRKERSDGFAAGGGGRHVA
jgi:hypothetical protein